MRLVSLSVALLSGLLAVGLTVGASQSVLADTSHKRNAKNAEKAGKHNKARNQITIDCQDGVAEIGVNGQGNIIEFESPLTYDHIGVGALSEGYVVAWDSVFGGQIVIHDVNGFNNANGFGWGAAAFVPGGNFSVRYSLDGSVKLTQTFTPDCDQRKLVVEHEVQNCTGGFDPICSGGGVQLNDVCLARQVDFDVDTGDGQGGVRSPGPLFINNHAASQDAYIAWNDKGDPTRFGVGEFEKHSMHLSILNPQRGPVFSVAKVTANILDVNCPANDAAFASPALEVDFGGRIEATTDDIAPGEAVTLLLEYKRD